MQISILLNPSNLDERLHESIAVYTSEFVSLTLKQIGNPDASLSGWDSSNLCVVMSSPLSTARTYVRMLADSQEDPVSVTVSWRTGFETWQSNSPKLLLEFQMLSRNLTGGRSQICVHLLSISLRNTTWPVCLQQVFLASLMGRWAHLFTWGFFSRGQMQYAITRSRLLNSFWIVLSEDNPACCVLCCRMDTLLLCAQGINDCGRQEATVFHVCGFANNWCDKDKEDESSNISCGEKDMVVIVFLHMQIFWFHMSCGEYFSCQSNVKNDAGIQQWRHCHQVFFHTIKWGKDFCLLGSDNDTDNQLLLTYIVERYANMRGTYFVRHLKGNSRNQIQKLADSQTTRTKVAHTWLFMQRS